MSDQPETFTGEDGKPLKKCPDCGHDLAVLGGLIAQTRRASCDTRFTATGRLDPSIENDGPVEVRCAGCGLSFAPTPAPVPAGRHEKLDAWLVRNNAFVLMRTDRPDGSSLTQCQLGEGTCVVFRHAHGFELYVPSSKSDDVTMKLDSAAVALDARGCRDL